MTTILIDGDVYIYRACWALQKTLDFGQGPVAFADAAQTKARFDSEIGALRAALRAAKVVVAFSDITASWRKELWPSYKAKRGKRPDLFYAIREYAEQRYAAVWKPRLEGDDVLGILATDPSVVGPKVVVSIDKDLQGVPCLLYNPEHRELGIRQITGEAADLFHARQTLTGDPVDEYPGCPGIGPKRADALLFGLKPEEYWDRIVRSYAKAGLTEESALLNARMARILRHGEYDEETNKITLWEPNRNASSGPTPSRSVKEPGAAVDSNTARSATKTPRPKSSTRSPAPPPASRRRKPSAPRASRPKGKSSRRAPAATPGSARGDMT